MSSENYKDQREIWKALRLGMHYGMGTPTQAGWLRYSKSLGHPSNYAQLKFHHVLGNTQYDMTGLKLAKIYAQAKKQAYLMRTQQMLPLTFFGDKYL